MKRVSAMNLFSNDILTGRMMRIMIRDTTHGRKDTQLNDYLKNSTVPICFESMKCPGTCEKSLSHSILGT